MKFPEPDRRVIFQSGELPGVDAAPKPEPQVHALSAQAGKLPDVDAAPKSELRAHALSLLKGLLHQSRNKNKKAKSATSEAVSVASTQRTSANSQKYALLY